MVTGLAPGDIAEPASLAAAAALLREDGPPVIFRGGGTKPNPGSPLAGPAGAPPAGARHAGAIAPATISTALLSGIVLHDPLDGVAIVRAGTSLAALQAELAPHGQWLAVDPPFSDSGATVGGIFSANDAGPRRLAYGTMRDLVIGATIVTGDGVVAHSGGRVIKNVAGFDLARLYCGAFGTLGLVAELALRLHPLRRESRTVMVSCPFEDISGVTRAIRTSGLTPTAVDWLWAAGGVGAGDSSGGDSSSGDSSGAGSPDGTLLARFEERSERATTAQATECLDLSELRRLDARILEGDPERAEWSRARRVLAGTSSDVVVRAVTRPSRTAGAARHLRDLAESAGVECEFVSHALVGVHTAGLRGAGQTGVAASWRTAIEELGGHVTVRRLGAEVREGLDRWGPPPDAIGLMRRVKGELDPQNRCAPGTFVGGI